MKASIGSVAENSSKEVYVFRGNIMVHRTVAGNCIPLGKGGGGLIGVGWTAAAVPSVVADSIGMYHIRNRNMTQKRLFLVSLSSHLSRATSPYVPFPPLATAHYHQSLPQFAQLLGCRRRYLRESGTWFMQRDGIFGARGGRVGVKGVVYSRGSSAVWEWSLELIRCL